MPVEHWLPVKSLHGRLSAAALASLIISIVLTVLLFLTATSAGEVVSGAQQTHDKVRVYTQIEDAAREYQDLSYASVNAPGMIAPDLLATARMRLEEALAEADRLPVSGERERLIGERIAQQGQAVVEHFRDPTALAARVNRVDAIYRADGAQEAMQEVRRITRPLAPLKETLNDEIRRGQETAAQATLRTQSSINKAVYASVAGFILALASSLALLCLLQARLRPSLKRLEEGVHAFRQGDLDHRVALSGRDELSRLSMAFDAMAATISEKQEALREVQLCLERKVRERTRELEEANGKLARADERRRAFLADVSHELRTPLTIIRGEAQVALRTADGNCSHQHEAFERILQQTKDLSRMVDDLLIIALAEAGRLPLEREVLSLNDLGSRVVGDFETLASEMGGSIKATVGPEVFAMCDPVRLRRAIAALIENSLKHSHRGVSITVGASATSEGVAISVGDDGPGLDFAKANCLFERFHRGETRGEGSGLGLSLVHALVLAHGGTTELTPRAGGGTVATLRFPFISADLLAA